MGKKALALLFLAAACALLTCACSPADRSPFSVEMGERTVYRPGDDRPVTGLQKPEQTFRNPVIGRYHEDVWTTDGVPDPFVMRYNGKYYLYPTSPGGKGVQCWISEDLTEWTYWGICASDRRARGAWAPEVVYYNGKFYMYTSPQGAGHYVLASDSPTGPFTAVSDNLGMNIDGSVFIDDDGDWYFFTSGNGGLERYTMDSPTHADPASATATGIVMGAGTAYTEGPMLIKYGGGYYLTYTGNEYRSTGYRINYAFGDSPENLVRAANNPVLIETDRGKGAGIGHSSTVIGPDLDSLYLAYHSWATELGAIRQMHIAPVFINGSCLQVMGHTVGEQQKPGMPDIYSRFDSEESLSGWQSSKAAVKEGVLTLSEGGWVISRKGLEGDYTAEFNFLSIEERACAYFGYRDGTHFGAACLDAGTNELEVIFTDGEKVQRQKVPVEASFGEKYDFGALQQLTLRKRGSVYTFLLNGRTVLECENDLAGGAFGAAAEKGDVDLGFVGAKGSVWLSGMKEYYKPLKGELQAVTCLEEDLTLVSRDGADCVAVSGGQTYNYCVNLDEADRFDLAVYYASNEDTPFELYCEGEPVMSGTLPSTGGTATAEVFRDVPLPRGMKVLTFRFTGGGAEVFKYAFSVHEDVQPHSIDLSQIPWFLEGDADWPGNTPDAFYAKSAGKFLFGSKDWGDYTVSVTFTPKKDDFCSYFLFRASQPAEFGPGNVYPELTGSFFFGYSLGLLRAEGRTTLYLNRNHYDSKLLAQAELDLEDGESMDLKVEARGKTIRVFVNGELKAECTDNDPILNGAVGFSDVQIVAVSDLKIEE